MSYVSINISPALLKEVKGLLFLEKINLIINKAGIKPNNICFEITESTVLEKCAYEFIEESNAQGFKVVIDDFGTGYSSMAHIADFSFNVLKIDRAFVNQILYNNTQKEIAYTIIQMAERLGVDVVAEGVETYEQLRCLREMGADAIQGYYFSRPVFKNEWNYPLFPQKMKVLRSSLFF